MKTKHWLIVVGILFVLGPVASTIILAVSVRRINALKKELATALVRSAFREALAERLEETFGGGKTAPKPKKRTVTTPAPPLMPAEPPRHEQLFAAEYAGQREGDFSTAVLFRLTNRTGRDVTGLKGSIEVYDHFGDHAESLYVHVDDNIPRDASVTEACHGLGQHRVRALFDQGKATYKFSVRHVLYADGTGEKFE